MHAPFFRNVLYLGENKWRKMNSSRYVADRLHQVIILLSASFQGKLSAVKPATFNQVDFIEKGNTWKHFENQKWSNFPILR